MPAPIPDESRRFIEEVWFLMKEEGLKTSGREVLEYAQKMRDCNPVWKHVTLPSLRTTGDIVSPLNKKGLDDEQEKPWTLGASLQYSIPSEANGDLLKISTRHSLLGRVFTIRQARWAAVLRNAVPFERLPFFARKYARRELMIGKGIPETTDLDIQAAFHERQLQRALWVIDAMPKSLHIPSEALNADADSISLDTEYWFIMEEPLVVTASLLLLPRHVGAPYPDVELSETAQTVFAGWLAKATRAPGWPLLPNDVKSSIAVEIFTQVAVKQAEFDIPSPSKETKQAMRDWTPFSKETIEQLKKKPPPWWMSVGSKKTDEEES